MLALSGAGGDIGAGPAGGAGGIYLDDRRLISAAVLTVDGAVLVPIGDGPAGTGGTRSVLVVRGAGDDGGDPTVWLERLRRVDGRRAHERIELVSAATGTIRIRLCLRLASDLADISEVKSGRVPDPLPGEPTTAGLRWTGRDAALVSAVASPPPDAVTGAGLHWDLAVAGGESVVIDVVFALDRDSAGRAEPVVAAVSGPSTIRRPALTAGDHRLVRLTEQSVADLAGLELADPRSPQDRFLAAGAPWYLTLFGRDSLITARMLLPLGTELAAGTLRTLARRQGRRVDTESAEEPGKIAHELRRGATDHGPGSRTGHELRLPRTYYGTVDATALWILLLHDAWRWGMPADEVAALLPSLRQALAWMRDYAMDDSGFLRYADRSGHGLANQGWKDSNDAVRFGDGRLAVAPVALAEVQAYAVAAARAGADLLDAWPDSDGDSWRTWADGLSTRFRDQFWIADADGDYPAMALDHLGVPVDALASNVGHLLGTGLLDRAESELVARRLGSPDLDSGYGLRTLAASSTGFNPLSYHVGSVWVHDTAIAISGLAAAAADGVPSAGAAATSLIGGLLSAGEGFGYQLPELFGGLAAEPSGRPVPYPASCRPQAWAAASSIAILSAVLGPRPDAPSGRIEFTPLRPSPVGNITVRGLRFGGWPLDVELSGDGTVRTG